MVRQILQMNDPILSVKCTEVKTFGTQELLSLVKDLFDTCLAKEDVTAGLSAPQIGEKLQVCICRRMDLEEKNKEPIVTEKLWEVMINPKIVSSSQKLSTFWEGCLSVGEGLDGLYGPVERPDIVNVEYQNVAGEKKTLKCVGFFSHIVQHELDHLNGVIFLKYVSNPEDIWLCRNLDDYYNKHGDYPPV